MSLLATPSRRPTLKRSISHAQRQFSWRQPIRPFVSSTFCDFEKEREYLVKHVFPRLDKVCHERGTYFAPIDLRWGISESQSSQGHVIQLCLDYIRKSSPYFVGLLGERYGSHLPPNAPPDHPSAIWFEKNLMIAEMNGFDWVQKEENRHKSITELEVIQAAFEKDSNPKWAFFYIRDPGAVAARLPEDLSDEERRARLVVYGAESEFADKQMKALKERIASSGLIVRHFSTVEDLGQMVLDDWINVIDEQYPQLVDSIADHHGALFTEWAAHESFAETRRRAFTQTSHISSICDNLTHYVITLCDGDEEGKRKQVIVLAGERGCGKTSVVANWMKAVAGQAPEIAFVAHYVGSSAASSDILGFLRYCTAEIRRFHTGSYITPTGGEADSSNPSTILEAFHGALSLGPAVILLDGLEEVTSGVYKHLELFWLPEALPNQCLFVVTTSTDHPTLSMLKQRKDTCIVEIPLLSSDNDKKAVIQQHLVMHRKDLNEHQYKRITSCDLSSRPLFLAALANEMRLFGKFQDVDKHLDHYLASTSIQDLWSRIILRWCQDYGWDSDFAGIVQETSSPFGNWVADVLRLIAVSRHGMNEQEILTVLKQLGYDGKCEVKSATLALLRSAVMDALFEKPGGMLSFFHSHLHEAVTNNLFTKQSSEVKGGAEPRVYHKFLVDYFMTLSHSRRRVEELPWQLLKANETGALCQVLSESDMFLQLASDAGKNPLKLDLLLYWKVLRDAGYDESAVYLDMLKRQRSQVTQTKEEETNASAVYTDRLEKLAATGQAVGQFLAENHKFDDSLLVLKDALQDAKRCHELKRENNLLLTEIQESIGHRFLYKLETGEAEKWYQMALETVAHIEPKGQREYELQGRILNELGQLCARGNRLESAEEFLLQAKQYMLSAESTPGLATVDYNMGILRGRQHQVREADNHLRQALSTRERWFGMNHLLVAEVLNETAGLIVSRNWYKRDQHRTSEALAMYQRAMEIRELHLGKDHLLVATTLFHKGKLLAQPHLLSKDEALGCLKRALEIRTSALGSDHRLTKAIDRMVYDVEAGKFGQHQGGKRGSNSGLNEGSRASRPVAVDAQRQPRQETQRQPRQETQRQPKQDEEAEGWQCVKSKRRSQQIYRQEACQKDRSHGGRRGERGRGHGTRRGSSEPVPFVTGDRQPSGQPHMRRVSSEHIQRNTSHEGRGKQGGTGNSRGHETRHSSEPVTSFPGDRQAIGQPPMRRVSSEHSVDFIQNPTILENQAMGVPPTLGREMGSRKAKASGSLGGGQVPAYEKYVNDFSENQIQVDTTQAQHMKTPTISVPVMETKGQASSSYAQVTGRGRGRSRGRSRGRGQGQGSHPE